ncbi:MAG: MBL fold metallo-hydrolase [bacterium]
MKLVVLGSGTCVPSLKRHSPGYYLNVLNKEILIDCGSGTLFQLEKAGKSYKSIDAIFITHMHPDHISDLVPLIQALIATPGFKREKDILIAGPNGLKGFYERCIASFIRRLKTFQCKLVEIKDRLDMDSLFVFSTKTVHTEESIAYRFEAEGKSVVITGDCDFDKSLIKFTEDADLVVIDCSFPDSLKVKGHMTSKECGFIANSARVKILLLSHIYPTMYPDNIRLMECSRVFSGDVRLAEDLLEINII